MHPGTSGAPGRLRALRQSYGRAAFGDRSLPNCARRGQTWTKRAGNPRHAGLEDRTARRPQFRFGVLGPLLVERDGERLSVARGRQRTLLAVLLESGVPVSRDRLIAEMWGDDPPPNVVSAFHVHLSRLRDRIGEVILADQGGYSLAGARWSLDAADLERLLEDARCRPERAGSLLRESLALFRGEPLCDVDGVERIPQWRRSLERKRLDTLVARIDAELSEDTGRELVPEIERLVADQPFDERVWAQLMVAQARSGRRADALETYRRARRLFVQELGLEPGERLAGLQRAIIAGEAVGVATLPSIAQIEPSPGEQRGGIVPSSGLPLPMTRLVGRDDELTSLSEILADLDVRVLTLTGPGGVGKTRLAIELAARRHADFADGALFVGLEAVDDVHLVGSAIATALARRDGVEGSDPDGLAANLRNRELLILLDNFEHLLAAGPTIAELVAQAPAIRVVVTSRTPLRLRGEQLFEVDPLELPVDESDARVARSPAVQLFVQSALAVDRNLEFDADVMRGVARICRALDGLPLAIELAASQMRTVALADIVSQLGSPLEVGEHALRDLPDRQQTLTSTISWSYRLLDEDERDVLRRAGVFRGGFTREALDAVCGRSAGSALKTLVEASLVARRRDGGRYSLLDVVRAFALGALDGRGDTDETFGRYRDYFAELVGPATEAFDAGRPPGEVAASLVGDHPNLRAGLESAIEAGDADGALRLALGMRPIWFAWALRQESHEMIERICERFPLPARGELALLRAASFLDRVDSSAVAHYQFTRRLAARAAELDDRESLAIAMGNLFAQALNARDRSEIHRLAQLVRDLIGPETPERNLGWLHYYLALDAYIDGRLELACEHGSRAVEAAGAIDHAYTLGAATAASLLARSARDRSIAQPDLMQALERMKKPAVQPLAVVALWFVARYAVSFDPGAATVWLARAEHLFAELDTQFWPESDLRAETMAALDLVDLEAALAGVPRVDHETALALAAEWVASRSVEEVAPRVSGSSERLGR